MTPEPANLFHDIPAALPEEMFQTLLSEPQLRIERIVSQGHRSPEGFWYDQSENEWVLVLQGEAVLQFDAEAEARRLKPGDFINIPARQRHRVAWTTPDGPTVWLAIFYGQALASRL